MEESVGSQYALQVALQTMKERCQQLQKRVSTLEEENLALKLKCANAGDEKEDSVSEVDALKTKIAEVTEEKLQLRNNMLMVASENRQLWNRLSKLSQDNKNLGSKLSKINESITQHTKGHSPLIRSKTFTQEAPHTKHLQKALLENDKISLELEDISLKLLSSITKEKNELEIQCTEMTELQNSELITDSLGFSYLNEELEDSMAEDFEQHLNDLKIIKNSLLLQKEKLLMNINNLQTIKVETCKKCAEAQKESTTIPTQENNSEDDLDTKTQLESLAQWGSPAPSGIFLKPNERDTNGNNKICPMCCRNFVAEIGFDIFLSHVEEHFRTDEDVLL